MFGLSKDDDRDDDDAQVSQGPNSFGDPETSLGGADSVAGTPDATPSTQLGEGDTPRSPSAS